METKGIGDAGMAHLHLIPESVEKLSLAQCGLTAEGTTKGVVRILREEYNDFLFGCLGQCSRRRRS